MAAELRELAHCRTVFLVDPREFQPELALRHGGRGVAAGHENPQRRVAMRCQVAHDRLEGAQLVESPTGQQSLGSE